MSEQPYSGDQRENPVPPIRPRVAASSHHPAAPYRHRPSLFWPIALIGIGVLLLLSNMGLIPATGWAVLWRLWPIALIALGLDVLIGRRSVGGAIASGILILALVGVAIGMVLFAEQIPLLVDLAKAPVMQYEHVEYPLNGAESADIIVDYTSVPGYISALDDSGNLIEADVAYRGDLIFSTHTSGDHLNVTLDSVQSGVTYSWGTATDGRNEWDVRLAPDVALALNLDAGSGACSFDLSRLNVTELILDAGSGAITLALPESGHLNADIDGGSGALTLKLPDDVGLRVTRDDGSGSFNPGDRLNLVSGDVDDQSVWETEGYSNADSKIDLTIDQGSGSLTIK